MASNVGLGRHWSSASTTRLLLRLPGRRHALVELATPRLTRSAHQGRGGNHRYHNALASSMNNSPTPSLNQRAKHSVVLIHPHTFIPEPLGKYILRPLKLLSILKTRVVRFTLDYAALVALSISSKPSWLKTARFKMKNSKVIPVAKAMHREYYEAVARGNTPALSKLTTEQHGNALAGIISKRPRGRRFEWELVRYTSSLLYPRIVDQKAWMLTPGSPTMRQTIVAISSTQRLVEYDDSNGGAVVSEKLVNKVENMMMVCEIDGRTFKQTDWKIHGFLEPMTVDLYEETKRLNDQAVLEE